MGKEKYEEYWKKKEEEREKSSSNGNFRRDEYEARWAENYMASLPERIENLTLKRDSLYKSYTSRFTDKDGNYINAYRGDTEDALTSFNSSKAYIDNESKAILDALSKYGKYLDADKVKGIKDYLSSYSGDLDGMYKTYQTDHEFFSQFEDEDAYNGWSDENTYSKKYAKSTYADLQKAKADIEKKLSKNKDDDVLNRELYWLQKHDTDRQYVDTMSNEELDNLKKANEQKRDEAKAKYNLAKLNLDVVNQNNIVGRAVAEAIDYFSDDYKNPYTAAQSEFGKASAEKEKIEAENGTVLYYDDNDVAVTAEEVLKMRENEPILANINSDAKVKSAYEKALKASEEITKLDHQIMGAETSRLLDLEAEKDNQQAIIDEFNALGYDFDSLKKYEEWKANREGFADVKKSNEEYAQEHPVLSTVQSILTAPLTPFELAENLIEANKYGYSNIYDDQNINQNQTYQTTVADMIGTEVMEKTDSELLSWLASGAYSGVTSSAQSAMTTLACTAMFGGAGGAVALGIMGTEAAASSYNNAIMNGSTNGEAILTAVSSGIAEAMFEKISLDKLIDIGKMYDVSSMSALLKSMLKNSGATFVQGGVEASEEFFTEIANKMADEIINGDHSAYNTAIAKYKKMGYSDTDAKDIATKDAFNEILEALYGGFIGGAGSGIGASITQGTRATGDAIANEIIMNDYYKQMGQNIVTNEGVQDLVDSAKEISSLRKFADKVAGVKAEDLTDDKSVKKYEKKVGKLYKGVTESQLKQLSKVKASETETNSFKELVKAELESAGVKNVDEATEIVVKRAFGDGKLTRAESEMFNSVNGRAVIGRVLQSEDLVVDEGSALEQVRNEYTSIREIAKFDVKKVLKKDLLKKTKYDVSHDDKTTIQATDEEVESMFITSVGDDDITLSVKVGDGYRIVKAGELSLNEDYAVVFEGIMNIKNDFGLDDFTANRILTLWEEFDGGSYEFYKAIESSFMYGQHNMRYDFEKSDVVKELPEDIRNHAFELGRRYKQKVVDKQEADVKANGNANAETGGFSITYAEGVTYEDLNKSQKAQVDFAQVIAQIFGFNLEIFRSPKNALGHSIGENGSYNTRTNTMRLDVDAGTLDGKSLILFTQSHELTHFIKKWSPKAFKTFADLLVEKYGSKGVSVDKLVNDKITQSIINRGKDHALSYNEALEEVVCDACEDFLADPNIQQTITEFAKVDKNLAQKIKDFLKGLITKLEEAIKGLQGQSAEAKALRELDVEDLEELKNHWSAALFDARENVLQAREQKNTTNEGDVKKADRIRENMTDSERYEILKNRQITLAVYKNSEYSKAVSGNPQLLDKKLKETDAKKLLKKIGTEFGVFEKYSNPDMEIEFEFGKNNLDESLHKQKGNYDVYTQLLSCFSDVITNAVGIEVHNRNSEGYKTDRTLKNVYVLCGAFENDTDIVPVKLEIKEFYDKPNRLYVAVALEGIKKDRVESMGVPNNRSHVRTSPVTISIASLFSKINTLDTDFLKYIPNGFLNAEQIEAKSDTSGDVKKQNRDFIEETYDSLSSAKNENGDELFQYRAIQHDVPEYRALLEKRSDMSSEQIDALFETMNKAFAIIEDNLEILDYAWDENLNEDGTWDDTVDARAFNPVKPNSDRLYKYSLDFSTMCRKRLLQQVIAEELSLALDRAVTKAEGIAIRNELIKLQEEGRQIEIACALCYVESARMKSPEQIQKFLNDAGQMVREFFATKAKSSIAEAEEKARKSVAKKYAKEIKEGSVSPTDTYTTKGGKVKYIPLSKLPKKMKDEIHKAKREAKSSYSPSAEEQRIIDIASNLPVTAFTTAEGLKNLAKDNPVIFDAYTSFVRNATHSKGTEKDVWYRVGDANKIGDDLIAAMNKENGLRSQSWSDFQVIHLLDYVGAIIELSTKKAKMQTYTKVPDYVNLMGLTGQMINLSLIPARDFNGKLEFDSVEGMAFKVARELRDKYPDTAGTISIGITNEQIQMLLDSMDIDYVIPYHHSAMSKVVRKEMKIPSWVTYQDYQNEKNITSKKDALANANKYGVKLLNTSDENYHKAPSFSEWFDLEEARQVAQLENLNPTDLKAQKKYGVMYGAYKAMQQAADNYLKICAERGLVPKFCHEKADFTVEDNYWKLLIDRKMINQKTGEIIEQKPVQPIFNEGEVLNILNNEIARYEDVKKDFDYATRIVTERFLNGDMNEHISEIAKSIGDTVTNVTKVAILNSDIKNQDRVTPEQDAEYLELAKNPEKNKARLREMVDSVAKKAGYKIKGHHGTGVRFTIFDRSKTNNANDFGQGFYFSSSEAEAQKYQNDDAFGDTYNKIDGIAYDNALERIESMGEDASDDALFTEIYNEEFDKELKRRTDEGAIINAYLRMDNPFVISDSNWITEEEAIDIAKNTMYVDNVPDDIAISDWVHSIKSYAKQHDGKVDTQQFANYMGHATSLTKALLHQGKYDGVLDYTIGKKFNSTADYHAIALHPNKIKDSALVTYDDNGNIIPLSERFNEGNDDIRYQDRVYNGSLTQERIDVLIHDSGAGNRVDYAREWIASINPSEFLDLTLEYETRIKGRDFFDAEVEGDHGSVMGDRDYLADLQNSNTIPVLYVNMDTGKVAMHNGRHRMRALEKAGASRTPVRIVFYNDDEMYKGNNKGERLETIDAMRLTSQFDDKFYRQHKAIIRDIIPLNEDHRDEIEKAYRAKPMDVKYGFTVAYQDRPVSDREVLVDAMSNIEELSIEDQNRLEIYKGKIENINELERELADVGKQIHKIITTKGSDRKQMAELNAKADTLRKQISRVDGELLKIEAMKPIQNLIEIRKKQVLKAHKQKVQEQRHKNVEGRHKTATKNKIKRVVKELDKLLNKGNKKANVKDGMQDMVRKALALSDLLLGDVVSAETILSADIPDERLSESESAMLEKWRNAVDSRTKFQTAIDNLEAKYGSNKPMEKYEDLVNSIAIANKQIKAAEKNLSELLERERKRLNSDSVKEAIGSLSKAYEMLKESNVDYISSAYDEYISDKLKNLVESLEGVNVKDMSLVDLQEVYTAYKMVLTTVRNANKLFVNGRKEDFDEINGLILQEINSHKEKRESKFEPVDKVLEGARNFTHNNLKPLYFFEELGSNTLKRIFYNEIARAQRVYAVDFREAREYIENTRKKHNYYSWNNDSQTIKLLDGRIVKFSMQELMSIYAYSKRPQADKHMSEGGFAFDNKAFFKDVEKDGKKTRELRSDAETPYRITEFELAKIKKLLGKERCEYVDDMQKYLSEDMANKGNSVTRVMYGIDIFNEDVYFPLKSSKDYKIPVSTTNAEFALKGSGFTKETEPSARNPIVLEGFDDVWGRHVNEMSTYHSLVLPIENMNKVLGYTEYINTPNSLSTKQIIRKVYGSSAVNYIENYIQDMNGGFSSNKGAQNLFAKGFSNFKKTAVGASMSTVIQQPTAIVRAMAMINPKYFVKYETVNHKALQEEMFKYAPISIIKQIGGFDAGGNRSAVSSLLFKEYKGIDKAKAFFEDKEYRKESFDDAMMLGATFADEIGWNIIWNAVKNEVKNTTTFMPGTDEFLNECGNRFDEVINATQVYDSILSRSGYMRSNNELVKMSTAFMGEPSTSFNMLYNAVTQAKRGNISKPKAVGIVTSVYVSVIAAAALKSLIYALRDDDDDESYVEKYMSALSNSLKEDVWIHNMLPFLSDIATMFDGWEVERTDMAAFKDVVDAFDGLKSSSKSDWRKAEDLFGAFAGLFGIPLKNVMRTGREIYNAYANIVDGITADEGDVGNVITESIFGETSSSDINEALEKGKTDKAKKIINDLVSDKVKQGKTEKEAKASIKASVTSYWKALYLQAYRDKDNAEMLRIRQILQSTGLYDNVVETCSNWIKSMKGETTNTTYKKW